MAGQSFHLCADCFLLLLSLWSTGLVKLLHCLSSESVFRKCLTMLNLHVLFHPPQTTRDFVFDLDVSRDLDSCIQVIAMIYYFDVKERSETALCFLRDQREYSFIIANPNPVVVDVEGQLRAAINNILAKAINTRTLMSANFIELHAKLSNGAVIDVCGSLDTLPNLFISRLTGAWREAVITSTTVVHIAHWKKVGCLRPMHWMYLV